MPDAGPRVTLRKDGIAIPQSLPHKRAMNDAIPPDLARKQFVETLGRIAKRSGMPMIAGQIAALLYLTPGMLSADELKRELGVSSGSISNNTRLLEDIGTIVRVVPKGGREHFFRSAPDATIRTLERDIGRWELGAAEIAAASAIVRASIENLPNEVLQKMEGVEQLFRGMSRHTRNHIDELQAGHASASAAKNRA